MERHVLVKRATVSGLLVLDFRHRFAEAGTRLAAWVRAGRLAYREHVTDGIGTAPGAIAELYRGENVGKRLIRLHDD
jgi:hypothetical protein